MLDRHLHGFFGFSSACALVMALVACASETNQPYDPTTSSSSTGSSGTGGAGQGGAMQPSSFFEGTYTELGVQVDAWAFNQEITELAQIAAAYDWATIEARVAAGTMVGDALAATEAAYAKTSEAKVRSPSALVTMGLSLGKASGGDEAKNKLAKQYVEKSLLVLTELVASSELDKALVDGGAASDKAIAVDEAVVVLATLESRMISRSGSESAELWGPGTLKITDDALAQKTGELFKIAHDKVAASAEDAPAAIERARVYASKYFYASGLNYLAKVESELAMGGAGEVPQAEGEAFSEGISTAFFGDDDAAASPIRALWTGPASGVTVSAGRPVHVGAYASLASKAAVDLGSSDKARQIRAAGQLAGVVDVSREALEASGADLAALEVKAADLLTAVLGGDTAAATAAAGEIVSAVTAAAK